MTWRHLRRLYLVQARAVVAFRGANLNRAKAFNGQVGLICSNACLGNVFMEHVSRNGIDISHVK
jgi:hypothetical protein